MKKKINNSKLIARIRRSKKARATIRRIGLPRLAVHKTTQHIYVQLILSERGASDRVLAQASSLEPLEAPAAGKVGKAAAVGALIAQRVKALNVEKVAFDRSGFKYHGRVKALADAAREAGLIF